MPFKTVSSAPYTPRTTNDSTGHNNAVAPYAAGINTHTHDPSDTVGNYGNSVPAWGSSNPLYSLHGPGGTGAGNDWSTTYNGSAAIPADPTETAINPANNTIIAQNTPSASITAAWGIHGELARIRGAIALMKGSGANWFDAIAIYADPMTTAGDTVYRNGSNVTARLPAGTANQVLTIIGGLPAWATSPAGFADPGTTPGDMIYRNGSNATTRLPIGSTNQVLTVVGGIPVWAANPAGFTDPETTAGDMIFRNGVNATSRLPVGTASQVLTVVGGVPSWANAVAGFTDPETTIGDMIFRNGSNVTSRLPVGTASQVLTVVGGVPSWANAVAGFTDPETTIGDMIFRNGSNATARLPIGSTNQLLTVIGGVPTWQTPAAAFVDPETTIGDIIYRNGSNVTARLPVGTANQVLTVVSGVPGWAAIPAGFSDPETTIGDMIFRNGSNATARLPIGSTNQVLTVVGGVPSWAASPAGFADPETTIGDMIYRNGSNATSRLPVGSTNQVLTVIGGVPAWAASVAGFTDPETTAGDMIYRNGSNVTARLPVGTNNQVLSVVSGVPSWITSPALSTSVAINTVFAGPASGSAGASSYRTLVANDAPFAVALNPATAQSGNTNVTGTQTAGGFIAVSSAVTAPSGTPTLATTTAYDSQDAGLLAGTYSYGFTYQTPFGETNVAATASISLGTTGGVLVTIPSAILTPSDATIEWINLYRTLAGGSTYYQLAQFPPNKVQSGANKYYDFDQDSMLTANTSIYPIAPSTNTTAAGIELVGTGVFSGPMGRSGLGTVCSLPPNPAGYMSFSVPATGQTFYVPFYN